MSALAPNYHAEYVESVVNPGYGHFTVLNLTTGELLGEFYGENAKRYANEFVTHLNAEFYNPKNIPARKCDPSDDCFWEMGRCQIHGR